jgi:ribose transport system permease protein
MIFALLLQAGVPWLPALLITILVGAAGGLINAFLCNVMGFMPFIATIGMQSVFKAIALLMVNGQSVAIPEAAIGFVNLCVGSVWVFPIPFVVMVILMFLYGMMIGKTKFGVRCSCAVQTGRAARLAGINS